MITELPSIKTRKNSGIPMCAAVVAVWAIFIANARLAFRSDSA